MSSFSKEIRSVGAPWERKGGASNCAAGCRLRCSIVLRDGDVLQSAAHHRQGALDPFVRPEQVVRQQYKHACAGLRLCSNSQLACGLCQSCRNQRAIRHRFSGFPKPAQLRAAGHSPAYGSPCTPTGCGPGDGTPRTCAASSTTACRSRRCCRPATARRQVAVPRRAGGVCPAAQGGAREGEGGACCAAARSQVGGRGSKVRWVGSGCTCSVFASAGDAPALARAAAQPPSPLNLPTL